MTELKGGASASLTGRGEGGMRGQQEGMGNTEAALSLGPLEHRTHFPPPQPHPQWPPKERRGIFSTENSCVYFETTRSSARVAQGLTRPLAPGDRTAPLQGQGAEPSTWYGQARVI